MTHASLNTSLNGPVTANVGAGAAPSGAAATLWNAGSNSNFTRASAEGLALTAELDAMAVPETQYAPLGVGHSAGGWDGNS